MAKKNMPAKSSGIDLGIIKEKQKFLKAGSEPAKQW